MAGDTVQVELSMSTDASVAGTGWDINWVRLYGETAAAAANGDIIAAGHVYAHSTTHIGDVAEYMSVAGEAAVGDVVVVDTEAPNRFRRSRMPYERALAGVVSTDPSVTLNSPKAGTPIGLTGRISVNVTGEGGDVRVGDALTSSSKPGFAMRAAKTGPIVGFALESFSSEKKEGKILMLLQPGWQGSDGGGIAPKGEPPPNPPDTAPAVRPPLKDYEKGLPPVGAPKPAQPRKDP